MQRAVVAGLYAALTFFMTWPLGVMTASMRLGGGADPALYVWTIGWGTHALTTAPWAAFNANIFFPYQHTLAYSENLLGSALLVIPVMWATGDALVATNVAALLSVLLCAYGGYYLGRTLGLSPAAAFLCGLIFAFTPPRFARLGQLHLTAVQWVPFTLAFLHKYLAQGQARHLRLAMAFLSLQALTSGHGAALLVLGCGIMLAFYLARGGSIAPMQRVRDVGVWGAIALVPAALAFIPYWLAKRDVPIERVHDDIGVTWASYVSSPTHVHQTLLSWMPDWEWLRQDPDAFLFPGIVVLALVGVALWRRSEQAGAEAPALQWRDRWVYLTMVLVTWWMTIGPPLSIWRWIYWMPGLNFIRVPSRFTMLGVLALAVLAAYGFDRVTRAWPRRRSLLAASALSVMLLAEFAMLPVHGQPYTTEIPAIDRWLDTQPKPFAIAEVPVSTMDSDARRGEVATMYMLHTLGHYQPTVLGYSGAEPDSYRGIYNTLIAFPSDNSIRRLTDLGVTYVVVHLEYFTDEYRVEYLARLAKYSDRLTLVHQEGLGQVYRLER
jgi:hypothetical protein